MIEARNVTKKFSHSKKQESSDTVAVNNANMVLGDGEFCALVGESGSGKSTISRILTGLIPPSSGEILLDGKVVSSPKIKWKRELYKRIQLVLQDGKSSLDPHMSVYDCIAEPIRSFRKLSRSDEKKQVDELIEQMELSSEILMRKPSELSGGQQKRVGIARALATNPEIIIFDESISGLDVIVRKSILDLLLRLHKTMHATYLFITHDMDVALYLAKHIFVMKDGIVVEDVKYNGDDLCFCHPYSRLLLDSMFIKQQNKTDISA